MATEEKPDTERFVLTPRMAQALTHELRVEVLRRIDKGVVSPKMLEVEMGLPLNIIAYHVRVLESLDCIELVETKPRRGAMEHFYIATPMGTSLLVFAP